MWDTPALIRDNRVVFREGEADVRSVLCSLREIKAFVRSVSRLNWEFELYSRAAPSQS